jgi:hypothetical protein
MKFHHHLSLKKRKQRNAKTALAHYLKNEGMGRLMCLLRGEISSDMGSVKHTLYEIVDFSRGRSYILLGLLLDRRNISYL